MAPVIIHDLKHLPEVRWGTDFYTSEERSCVACDNPKIIRDLHEHEETFIIIFMVLVKTKG